MTEEYENQSGLTDEEYKVLRMSYSHNDQKAWEEDGKSEEERRGVIEYEATLTSEEKAKAREMRQNAREAHEMDVKFEQIHKPDSDRSEKELLIDIKNLLVHLNGKNSNFTNELLKAGNEIKTDINKKLWWIIIFLFWFLVALSMII